MANNEIARIPGRAPEPAERPSVPTIARDIVRPRLPEIGRIRLGEKDEKKGYPKKLTAFRFTSRNRPALERVAELWGGEVTRWDSDEGPQWQVYTTAAEVECIVPKAELAFSQYFEDWEGATCNRRCDGHWEMQGDRECVCDADARKCLPTTRLSVLLPDIPGMGVWRVESHGYNAAAEILGTIELAAAYGASLIPATLSLAQRTKRRRNDKGEVETRRFVVPVLSLSASLREMVAEQNVLRQRTLGLLPMAELAPADRMVALRTAVFTRWPKSVDEPERSVRLAQLSRILGREVTTISNDHDLTAQEAIFLTNAVEQLQDAPDSSLGEGAQAGPGAGGAGPAQTSAGGNPELAPVTRPDEPPPAEYISVGDLGEVPPPEGNGPESAQAAEGKAASASLSEPAPDSPLERFMDEQGIVGVKPKATPKRPRTKAPSVAQVREAQQAQTEAKRKQTTVDRTPANWLQTLPPRAVEYIMAHFGNMTDPGKSAVEFVEKYRPADLPPLETWQRTDDWANEQIDALVAKLPGKGE